MENQLQPGGIIHPTTQPASEPSPVPPVTPVEPVQMAQPSSPVATSPVSYPAAQTPLQSPAPVQAASPAMPPQAFNASAAPAQNLASPEYHMPAFMNPEPVTNVPTPMGAATKSGHKKKFGMVMVILAVVLLLGGGSAAAYFGYVLPNKPENKMLSAFGNLASQKNVSLEGNVIYTTQTSSDGGSTSSYKIALNTTQNQLSLAGSTVVSGSKVPFELRYLDKTVYVKISGLDKVGQPGYTNESIAPYIGIIKQVNNQWYSIDSSFTQQFGIGSSCYDNASLAFTKADIATIKAAYKKHPLFKIKSSSAETVDGTATTKYIVDPASGAEASAFTGELKDLSMVKKINNCSGNSLDKVTTDAKSQIADDSGTTNTLAIYISKDKQLKKIELTSKDKSGSSAKIDGTFSYAPVSVTKPEGAKSFTDLFSSIFGGASGDSTINFNARQSSENDTRRQTAINAIHAQAEAYWAQVGYYPTLQNLNTPNFTNGSSVLLDTTGFQDPDGTNTTIVSKPQKGAYSYEVKPAGCNNIGSNQCISYVLTATLSDGTTYTKASLN